MDEPIRLRTPEEMEELKNERPELFECANWVIQGQGGLFDVDIHDLLFDAPGG